MSDPLPGLGRPAPAAHRRDGYDATRAVEMRARSTRWSHDADTRAALARLDERLASGTPPRPDVPPGTYLDITI